MGLLIIAAIITVVDLFRIFSYDVYPSLPAEAIRTSENEIYADLVSGNTTVNWEQLHPTLDFIGKQFDTSDFKMVNLVRILYEFDDQVPSETREKIDSTLLNFRYWMDEPGENGICYWSENHQILFASAEYLVGKRYRDQRFRNSGMMGSEHAEKARQRILKWLELRWLYGFTEFYSGVYYIENVAALLNLIDHSGDEEITTKSKIILDLLFHDIATQSFRGMTVSVSGRAYESNRKGGANQTMNGITDFLLRGKELPPSMVFALGHTVNYTIPPVFKEIARDTTHAIIRQSNGLDMLELKEEGLLGSSNNDMLMQWGMEAFTNAPVIQHSMSYIKEHRMFSNQFLKEFRYLDFSLLTIFSLHSPLSKWLQSATDGKAIQRGNTYTYRTADYSLYSVQRHHPGDFADQHHVAGMNIGNHFSVFHTHPARREDDPAHSPNYNVGYGRLPHVAQDENVSMAIYHVPGRPGFMEKYLLDYTYAHFPIHQFDTVQFRGHYLFGKKENVYCALIGSSDFSLEGDATAIQPGRKNAWIMEAGSTSDEKSFDDFVERVMANPVHFDEEQLILTYTSRGKTRVLQFKGTFSIDGQPIDLDYPRFDSPYARAERKPEHLLFEWNGAVLFLDFYNGQREFSS